MSNVRPLSWSPPSSPATSPPTSPTKPSLTQISLAVNRKGEPGVKRSLFGVTRDDASNFQSIFKSSSSDEKWDKSLSDEKWDEIDVNRDSFSDSGSESGSTPKTSEEKAPKTPVKHLVNMIERNKENLAGDLLPSDDQRVQKALKAAIDRIQSFDLKTSGETARGKIDAVFESLVGKPDDQSSFHANVVGMVKSDNWSSDILIQMREVGVGVGSPYALRRAVALGHILKGDENGGCHYFSPDDPRVKQAWVNPRTKVIAGCIEVNGTVKFSTSFPHTVGGVEALTTRLVAVDGVVVVAKNDKFILQRCENGDDEPYLVEMVTHQENWVVLTAYPIFYHADYRDDEVYQPFPEMTLTSCDVLSKTREIIDQFSKDPRAKNKYNPIRYLASDQLIVDLGPTLWNSEDRKGLYFFIPKELIPVQNLAKLLRTGV